MPTAELKDALSNSTIVEKRLQSVCWNFVNSDKKNSLHSIHPYPAKFIPEIPRMLLSLFPPKQDTVVLDPFCGSGTTLVEAQNDNKPAIGIDLNPLSALISKVKTTFVKGDIVGWAAQSVEAAQNKVKAGDVVIPAIPNVDHWFQKDVQQALSALITSIRLIPDEEIQNALKVALSSIIVRVSNQDSDTRYAAVEKNIPVEAVWLGFERAAGNIATLCGQGPKSLYVSERQTQQVQVINKDLMAVEPEEIGRRVGLVITSPPYPNAYEYWLYHKYRMFWLGMNPLEVKEREIGARAHYFKKNHQTEHDFERQMERCFWLLSKVMEQGAIACFVVGRSIIHGREIDNEALLERAASLHGFRLAGTAHREIAASRKSFNLHHAKIRREGVMVLCLEGK